MRSCHTCGAFLLILSLRRPAPKKIGTPEKAKAAFACEARREFLDEAFQFSALVASNYV